MVPDYPGLFPADSERVMHLYSLCLFRPGDVVPAVEVIEALDDSDALLIAKGRRASLDREIWDRHRLVARLARRS